MKPEQKKFVASVCMSAGITYTMPTLVSVLTMAFFMWTSSYYPKNFVDAVIRSWMSLDTEGRPTEDLEDISLPQPVHEALKTVRRLGRRFNSLLI